MTDAMLTDTLPAAAGNRVLLEQGIELLGRLPAETYATAPAGHSAVGAQFRHILDHYESLLSGIESGRVDYDARRRNPKVESDPAAAADAARSIILELARLESGADMVLMVQTDSGADTGPDWRESSLGRELQFLASHTTHHFALIRLLLALQGIECSADFGMAPSTKAHAARAH